MTKKNIKIVTVIGARPQFIKAATISRVIEKHNIEKKNPEVQEIIVHTGQHYDLNMSQIFFDQLKIPIPKYHLEVGSGSHGQMTGKMLVEIETVLQKEKPDWVLVYGDTNSTLAGALAAVKLHIPVGHVEAGLRSFNRRMPEEINRVVTDHISTLLFCPTITAVNNLENEGITEGVFQVGDVMYDAFLFHREQAFKRSTILLDLDLKPKKYCLATVHRQENTDDSASIINIFSAFEEIAKNNNPIIIPIHPRTRKTIDQLGIKGKLKSCIRLISPVGYMDMLVLESNACVILTDSGGIQKEAYFAKIPCVTLRDETEWVETEQEGWNHIGGSQTETILSAYQAAMQFPFMEQVKFYGDGTASQLILQNLLFTSHQTLETVKFASNKNNNSKN